MNQTASYVIWNQTDSPAWNQTNSSDWNQKSSNQTTPLVQWIALPIIVLLTFLTGLSINGGLLVVFLTHKPLRTPFNLYVVNLLIANCCCIALQFPFDFISDLYGGAWPIGEAMCSFYIIVASYFQAVIFSSHQLIAINRIWAVVRPISYRNRNSRRTSCYLCIAVWVYVFVGIAPGVIQDAMYYREPADGPFGCVINTPAQMGWGVTVQIIYYDWPPIMMVIALVIILAAKRKRTRLKLLTNRSGAIALIDTGTQSQKVTDVVTVQDAGAAAVVAVGGEGGAIHHAMTSPPPAQRRPVQQNSNGDLLLVLLTISVIVCWTPDNVYFTFLLFDALDAPVFFSVAMILLALQATIDPILFIFSLTNLRNVLRGMFCRRWR